MLSLSHVPLSPQQRWQVFVALVQSSVPASLWTSGAEGGTAAAGSASSGTSAGVTAAVIKGPLQLKYGSRGIMLPLTAAMAVRKDVTASIPAISTWLGGSETSAMPPSALDAGLALSCQALQYLNVHKATNTLHWTAVGSHALPAAELGSGLLFTVAFERAVLPALLTQAVLLSTGVRAATFCTALSGVIGMARAAAPVNMSSGSAGTRCHWLHAVTLGHWFEDIVEALRQLLLLTSDAAGHPSVPLPPPTCIFHPSLYVNLLDICGFYTPGCVPTTSLGSQLLAVVMQLQIAGLAPPSTVPLLTQLFARFGCA